MVKQRKLTINQSQAMCGISHIRGSITPESQKRSESFLIALQSMKGTALNDHLLTGPDLTNRLNGVLCCFRMHPIAVMCDVEKMFHRFHVSKEG